MKKPLASCVLAALAMALGAVAQAGTTVKQAAAASAVGTGKVAVDCGQAGPCTDAKRGTPGDNIVPKDHLKAAQTKKTAVKQGVSLPAKEVVKQAP